MNWNPRRTWTMTVGLVLVSLPAAGIAAQESNPLTPGQPRWADSFVVMTPGARYAKGGLGVAFAGRHYRDLWTTPIRVPVLDLRQFAGGLTPVSAHTGSQTKSLRFTGANGHQYQFRAVDKDPTAALVPELRGSAYAKSLQDGVSASFPAAPLRGHRAAGGRRCAGRSADPRRPARRSRPRRVPIGFQGRARSDRGAARRERGGHDGWPTEGDLADQALSADRCQPGQPRGRAGVPPRSAHGHLHGRPRPAPRPVPLGVVREGPPDPLAADLARP